MSTGPFFIVKNNLLCFAILLTRGGSKDESGHQQKKQWCAKECDPEVGIVHLIISFQSQSACLAVQVDDVKCTALLGYAGQ